MTVWGEVPREVRIKIMIIIKREKGRKGVLTNGRGTTRL
jgi:hypothetical protein